MLPLVVPVLLSSPRVQHPALQAMSSRQAWGAPREVQLGCSCNRQEQNVRCLRTGGAAQPKWEGVLLLAPLTAEWEPGLAAASWQEKALQQPFLRLVVHEAVMFALYSAGHFLAADQSLGAGTASAADSSVAAGLVAAAGLSLAAGP